MEEEIGQQNGGERVVAEGDGVGSWKFKYRCKT